MTYPQVPSDAVILEIARMHDAMVGARRIAAAIGGGLWITTVRHIKQLVNLADYLRVDRLELIRDNLEHSRDAAHARMHEPRRSLREVA